MLVTTDLALTYGVRDSYFLSQPNGTWVESSETHLSHSNFVVFNHGSATGILIMMAIWILLSPRQIGKQEQLYGV